MARTVSSKNRKYAEFADLDIRYHVNKLTKLYITWFVTSKFEGLYVVIPFVPIEKILLYFPRQECFVVK